MLYNIGCALAIIGTIIAVWQIIKEIELNSWIEGYEYGYEDGEDRGHIVIEMKDLSKVEG